MSRSTGRRAPRLTPGSGDATLGCQDYISLVISGAGGEVVTAAQVVLIATSTDDAGASTADRYDWQAAAAAADGRGGFSAGPWWVLDIR
jgi:hypothetical protein